MTFEINTSLLCYVTGAFSVSKSKSELNSIAFKDKTDFLKPSEIGFKTVFLVVLDRRSISRHLKCFNFNIMNYMYDTCGTRISVYSRIVGVMSEYVNDCQLFVSLLLGLQAVSPSNSSSGFSKC